MVAAQGNELVFGITEGVTYQATPKEIRDKFAPIAQVIATATGRRVRTVLVPAYDDARAGLKAQEFDVAFLHPAHIPMAEIKAGVNEMELGLPVIPPLIFSHSFCNWSPRASATFFGQGSIG